MPRLWTRTAAERAIRRRDGPDQACRGLHKALLVLGVVLDNGPDPAEVINVGPNAHPGVSAVHYALAVNVIAAAARGEDDRLPRHREGLCGGGRRGAGVCHLLRGV